MKIKKIILAVFIVLSLSLSFQPVNLLTKERKSVIYVIDQERDNFTNEFIKTNETKRLYNLVSLTLCVMIADETAIRVDTS